MGDEPDRKASITMTALCAHLERARTQLADVELLLAKTQGWAVGLPQRHTSGEPSRVIDWSDRDTQAPSDFERGLLQLLTSIDELATVHDFVIRVQGDILIRPLPGRPEPDRGKPHPAQISIATPLDPEPLNPRDFLGQPGSGPVPEAGG